MEGPRMMPTQLSGGNPARFESLLLTRTVDVAIGPPPAAAISLSTSTST